ncbi:MAG: DNA double-strand break repair nuclease NurA [Euryarchaeota archaeon]|nr:DNA double-strand break repair nuclease NurA [Euryarchaeota archaeon]
MLELTYETFARKRPSLRRRLEELLHSGELREYRELWHSYEARAEPCTAAGVDGSSNCKRYKALLLYAVNAVAVSYDGSLGEKGCADVDFLTPYKYLSERLDLYRSTLELKVALEVVEDVELLMLDGSLHSSLTAPKQWWRFMEREEVEEVLKLLPELEESEGTELLAKRLASGLSAEQVMLLEYLEYLVAIQKLVERGIEKIVAVAKTSTDSSFNRGIPDMAVLEEVTSGAGYSTPRDRMIKMHYPIYDHFFRSLVFTSFYARLERGKGMLMIELPREVDEEEIREELLPKLSHFSVDGYPYLLRKAHRRVVISTREVERLAAALGIGEKTGREVLEW